MKKLFVSSFLVLAMALTGCQDAIDIIQPGELSEEIAFRNLSDLESGLNVAYAQVSNNTPIELSSIWVDEVGIGYDNGGQGLGGAYTYSMNSGSAFAANIYSNNLYIISRANRIIAAAELYVPVDATEQTRLDNTVAHAKFLRGYAHFQLLTYFSQNLMDPNALGVPVIDYIPLATDAPIRATNSEVLALIDEDLNFAFANLLPSTDVTLASKNAVLALKSRVALFTGDYASAASISSDLINSYSLADTDTYPDIWADADNTGIIFKLERAINGSQIGSLWFSKDQTRTGSSFYEVGRSLFHSIGVDDVRRGVIVNLHPTTGSIIDPGYATSGNYRQSDVLLINKYPGSHGTLRLNDLKIFRIEEQYFINAEAIARQGNLNGAAALMQELIDVRYTLGAPVPTVTYTTLQQALAGILDQRRIELAFEGHRYVDLKRLGVEANRGIDRDPKDVEIIGSPTPPATNSHVFTLPIPAREVTINPGLIQNPGY